MDFHKSVLLGPSIDLLRPKDGGTYLDLTLGRAGHSLEIARRAKDIAIIGFDLDEEAIAYSEKILSEKGISHRLIHGNFAHAGEVLGDSKVDGIIADLGVSSPQFDDPSRGFSYREDAPLDMRMDTASRLSAYDVVNGYPYEELVHILFAYGEEKDAKAIAKAIVSKRQSQPIRTTLELSELIKEAKPYKSLLRKGHPAKQSFQAIRIEVNGELDSIKKMLLEAPYLLKSGGRMAVISFHSLEDRLVKDRFRELTRNQGSRTDILRPQEPSFLDLTNKPILPTMDETQSNPRAKSAKLRGIERK